MQASYPLQVVYIDILGPLPAGSRSVLVVVDHFTKWAKAYGIINQKATTVARKLKYFVDFPHLSNCTAIKADNLNPI